MFSDMNGDFFCVCTCRNEKKCSTFEGTFILEATEKNVAYDKKK